MEPRKTNDPHVTAQVDERVVRKENRDPISGEKGAHPVGTGLGAAAGGVTGLGVGAAVGGPIGAAIGAATGAIAGAFGGKAVAETIDPTVETEYWRTTYRTRPYVAEGDPYTLYEPAFRLGWESRSKMKHEDYTFDDAESELSRNWQSLASRSNLEWEKARHAVRDAWDRVSEQRAAGEGMGTNCPDQCSSRKPDRPE